VEQDVGVENVVFLHWRGPWQLRAPRTMHGFSRVLYTAWQPTLRQGLANGKTSKNPRALALLRGDAAS
jgi:hypothetical protein